MSAESEPNIVQMKAIRIVSSILQLVMVAVCLEMLIGISDGIGMPLRLFLFSVVMMGVVVRLGWLSLIAIQFSLLLQEPRRGQLAQSPSGFFWATIAMLTIIAAMKLPQSHRAITDYFLRFAGLRAEPTDTKQAIPSAMKSLVIQVGLVLAVVILAIVVQVNIPIGRQSARWLQSSLSTGQAFWPGTFWLVLIVALFVLAREIAWRKIDAPQARLYVRSVQLIAYFRDLVRFERERTKRGRIERETLDENAKPPKMRGPANGFKTLIRNRQDKTDPKGTA